MDTKVSDGSIHVKIYLGEEEYEIKAAQESDAVQHASYRALMNTLYAFKDLPLDRAELQKRKADRKGMYDSFESSSFSLLERFVLH